MESFSLIGLVLRSQRVVHGWDHSEQDASRAHSHPKNKSNLIAPWSVTKVTSLRTDTTLDLSQKAEKVCLIMFFNHATNRIMINQNGAPSGNRTRG